MSDSPGGKARGPVVDYPLRDAGRAKHGVHGPTVPAGENGRRENTTATESAPPIITLRFRPDASSRLRVIFEGQWPPSGLQAPLHPCGHSRQRSGLSPGGVRRAALPGSIPRRRTGIPTSHRKQGGSPCFGARLRCRSQRIRSRRRTLARSPRVPTPLLRRARPRRSGSSCPKRIARKGRWLRRSGCSTGPVSLPPP